MLNYGSMLARYPYVATEVLCSEIWSIVETCVTHSEQLMMPFWETVLDRSPEDMKTQMVMASHFTKINAVFLSKMPAEVVVIFSEPMLICPAVLFVSRCFNSFMSNLQS